jgi:hypothetical protein
MLLKREMDRIGDETRDRARKERAHWARDKRYIEWMVEQANVRKLRASFDDTERTVSLTDGKITKRDLVKIDAEIAIKEWPGSHVVDFDEDHFGAVIVKKGSRTETVHPPIDAR